MTLRERVATTGRSDPARNAAEARHSMRLRVALLCALVVCIPVVALAYAQPRLVIQAIAPVSCFRDVVCTDDAARSAEAAALYDEALLFLAQSIAPLDKKPLAVFCASDSCYEAFGRTGAAARSVGGFCIVVGPRGWKPYYVRHEMIHRLQWQHLGAYRMFREPEWFVEGMAYALSGDSRETLAPPFQEFRAKFLHWYDGVPKDELWDEARKL